MIIEAMTIIAEVSGKTKIDTIESSTFLAKLTRNNLHKLIDAYLRMKFIEDI